MPTLRCPTTTPRARKPGFYTPASYVVDNDRALGEIVAGLSRRPDWERTVVFVTCDDAQGTGDLASYASTRRRPYVRRTIDHTRYSIPSILRTVEVLYGLQPLTIYDAAATPMVAAFARQPLVSAYTPLAESVGLAHNPGKATTFVMPLDGPEDEQIRRDEWSSLRGTAYASRTSVSGS